MGVIADSGHTAWRKFETDGVPGSGAWTPDKDEIRTFVDAVDAAVAGLAGIIPAAGSQAKRATPSGFIPIGLRPLLVQEGFGPGLVHMDHTPLQTATLRRRSWLSPATVYAAPGASGAGTRFDPCSLTTAIQTSTASFVHLYEGTYEPFTATHTDAAHAAGVIPKLLLGPQGVTFRAAGPALATATWTVHSGTVYKTGALSVTGSQTPNRVFRIDTYDAEFGQAVRLLQFTSAAALVTASTSQGWAWDDTAKVMYIRLSDLAGGWHDVHSFRSQLSALWSPGAGGISECQSFGIPLGFFGPITFMGVCVGAENVGSVASELYMDGGPGKIMMFCPPEQGVQTYGGYVYVARVKVHAPNFDCFNYNAGRTTLANSYVTELDCEATSAGDIQSFGSTPRSPNLNGSSAHDDVQILRAGGFYAGGWGPVIADVGPGTSWNICNVVRDTEDTQEIGYIFATGKVGYLDQCMSSGNTVSIQAAGATAKQFGGSFDGTTTGVGTYSVVTGS